MTKNQVHTRNSSGREFGSYSFPSPYAQDYQNLRTYSNQNLQTQQQNVKLTGRFVHASSALNYISKFVNQMCLRDAISKKTESSSSFLNAPRSKVSHIVCLSCTKISGATELFKNSENNVQVTKMESQLPGTLPKI